MSVLIVSMAWIERQLAAEEKDLPLCWVSNKGSELYVRTCTTVLYIVFLNEKKEMKKLKCVEFEPLAIMQALNLPRI